MTVLMHMIPFLISIESKGGTERKQVADGQHPGGGSVCLPGPEPRSLERCRREGDCQGELCLFAGTDRRLCLCSCVVQEAVSVYVLTLMPFFLSFCARLNSSTQTVQRAKSTLRTIH